jgi:predicted transcriptional regulator of viral defense system
MSRSMEQLRYHELPDCFSDAELRNVVPGTAHRRYGLLKRVLASGELVHLRRGLYCLGERYRRHAPNLYAIAERLYGPSYVSFESALAHHGWIPEAVPTVTSASARRSKLFETPLGVFSFTCIPARVFFAHVERIAAGADVFFMARPWRAVADYVYANGKAWKGLRPLIEGLRVEEEHLRRATREELEDLSRSFGRGRVTAFLRGCIRELGL